MNLNFVLEFFRDYKLLTRIQNLFDSDKILEIDFEFFHV